MFKNPTEQYEYIAATYPDVTAHYIDDSHWDLNCTVCNIARGFQVVKFTTEGSGGGLYGGYSRDLATPKTLLLRCPVCKAYKQWIIYEITFTGKENKRSTRQYRVASLPAEGLEEIGELPKDPPDLRIAYREAIRAMDANANIAAGAMFRRALQVITRQLLGAKHGNLANELREVVGKRYGNGVVGSNFAEVGYIVKEAGNQASHPDADPDLLQFTAEDARDLQKIFMEIVSDLFVIPAAAEKAKKEFLDRRKITPKAH
jgi:hypothetical protein